MNIINRLIGLRLSPDAAGGAPVGAIPVGVQSDPTIPDAEFDAELGVTPPAAEESNTVAETSTPADDSASGPAAEDVESEVTPAAPATPERDPATGKFEVDHSKRDYTKFPAEIVDYVKRLPNKYFAQAERELIPLVEKAKKVDTEYLPKIAELEKQLSAKPSFAHEHPDGYVLDPEFQQVATLADRAAFEASHYEEQLTRILSGEGYQVIRGYDKRTGQPVFDNVPAPENGRVDTRAQVEMQRLLNEASMKSGQFMAARDSIRANYANEVQRSNAELIEGRKRIFRDIDESKFNDIEKGYMRLVVDALPRAHKRNPLATDLGYALVYIKRLEGMYNELAKKQTTTTVAAAKAAKAGPRPAPVSGTAAGKPNDFVDFSKLDD